MRTSNPALGDDTFHIRANDDNTMTLGGTVIKSLILLAILCVGFVYTFNKATVGYTEAQKLVMNEQLAEAGDATAIAIPQSVYNYALVGTLGGFVLAMIIIFWQTSAPFLSPIYAGLEGIALGAISAGFEAKFPGIVLQAAGATFGTLFGLLAVYMTGLIKPSENFKLGLFAAMCGILVAYFADSLMQMFGGTYIPVLHANSGWGLVIQGAIVLVAALNLVLDFDFIEEGCGRAPKYMEWYASFGLMVTLVWLYLEILKLLAKIRSNDD